LQDWASSEDDPLGIGELQQVEEDESDDNSGGPLMLENKAPELQESPGKEGHIANAESFPADMEGVVELGGVEQDMEETTLDLEEVPTQKAPTPGLYVAIVKRRRFRRLHRYGMRGACPLVPGIDYRDFEPVEANLVENAVYDDFCLRCWRKGESPESTSISDLTVVGSSSEDSDSPSSSSSDSEEEVAELVEKPGEKKTGLGGEQEVSMPPLS
jgi:hypothetical protein